MIAARSIHAKFAHVAGQSYSISLRSPRVRLASAASRDVPRTVGQTPSPEPDIFAALAQRSDVDRHHAQAIEKVARKFPSPISSSKARCVALIMRTSTGIDSSRPVFQSAVLPGAQQFCLHVRAHVANLIKEERAAIGCSNFPLRRAAAP